MLNEATVRFNHVLKEASWASGAGWLWVLNGLRYRFRVLAWARLVQVVCLLVAW